MYKNKWKVFLLSIAVLAFSIGIYHYFWTSYSTTSVEKMLETDRLNPKKILKQYEYEDSVDIFLLDQDTLILNSLKKETKSRKVYFYRGIISETDEVFSDSKDVIFKNNLVEEVKFQIKGINNAPRL